MISDPIFRRSGAKTIKSSRINRRITRRIKTVSKLVLVVSLAFLAPAIKAAQAPTPPVLSCLERVEGVRWERWMGTGDATLDDWCSSVGKPVFRSPVNVTSADVAALQILSWNTKVGGGRAEDFVAQLRRDAAEQEAGLVVLLQETFRGGWDVPETYPRGLHVPNGIRPRRPAPDIVALATALDLWVAYVPSMRNGRATDLSTREDRGNAILSTEPLSDIAAIELPFGEQRRVALAATVSPRGSRARPLRVITFHFDADQRRSLQADALGAYIAATVGTAMMPVVAAGDLNARDGANDGTVRALSSSIRVEDCGNGRTFRLPLRVDALFLGRLDFVFSTLDDFGLTRTCETLREPMGSDHVPLLMTVRF
jgi:endonuclease/exonuclease/phosphatase family metal-dependent hydrolase